MRASGARRARDSFPSVLDFRQELIGVFRLLGHGLIAAAEEVLNDAAQVHVADEDPSGQRPCLLPVEVGLDGRESRLMPFERAFVPIEGRHQALECPSLAVGPGAIEPPLLLTTLRMGLDSLRQNLSPDRSTVTRASSPIAHKTGQFSNPLASS